jgi:hypothetical protein
MPDTEEQIKTAYRNFFRSEDGKIIRRDWARFCGLSTIESPPILLDQGNLAFEKGMRHFFMYNYACMEESFQKEIEENVGMERESTE